MTRLVDFWSRYKDKLTFLWIVQGAMISIQCWSSQIGQKVLTWPISSHVCFELLVISVCKFLKKCMLEHSFEYLSFCIALEFQLQWLVRESRYLLSFNYVISESRAQTAVCRDPLCELSFTDLTVRRMGRWIWRGPLHASSGGTWYCVQVQRVRPQTFPSGPLCAEWAHGWWEVQRMMHAQCLWRTPLTVFLEVMEKSENIREF